MPDRTSETDQFIVYGDYFRQLDYNFRPVGISTLQIGMMFNRDFWGEDEDTRKGVTFGVLYRWNDSLADICRIRGLLGIEFITPYVFRCVSFA